MRDTDFLDRLLLAGLAFGAGLGAGLLLAPAPGSATRRRVAASARYAADRARIETARLGQPLVQAARDRARRLSERHLPLAGDLDVFDTRVLLDELRSGRS